MSCFNRVSISLRSEGVPRSNSVTDFNSSRSLCRRMKYGNMARTIVAIKAMIPKKRGMLSSFILE